MKGKSESHNLPSQGTILSFSELVWIFPLAAKIRKVPEESSYTKLDGRCGRLRVESRDKLVEDAYCDPPFWYVIGTFKNNYMLQKL